MRGVNVIFYIFIIAVVNVVLGFVLATHLARRYRALVETPTSSPLLPAGSLPTPQEWQEEDTSTETELSVHETEGQGELEVMAEQTGVTSPDSNGPRAPDREKAPSAAAIHDFQNQVQDYEKKLASVDAALRSCVEDPDEQKVKACLDSLQEANQEYVEHRDQAHEALEKLSLDQDTFDSIRENLKSAILRQSSSVETADAAAKQFDYEGDLQEGCQQMVGQTNNLFEANDHLRDTLGDARMEASRKEQLLEETETRSQRDPLTRLSDRTALEAELHAWWQRDPHRQRPLCVAMVDVDEFNRVNEQYGRMAGDAILRGLAKLFLAEARDGMTVSRFAGERFVFLFPDNDIRSATTIIERIRQTVELAHFEYRDTEVQVTISCSVTGVAEDDHSDTIFARAEATLQEAKRYGRNRTFQHEGKYPTPVVPPNFTLGEKHLTI